VPSRLTPGRLAAGLVALAAVLPYLPTLDNYFAQDDFGVVQLMASRSLAYFPRWFVMPWTENIWQYTPDEIRPFVASSYVIGSWWDPASPVLQHILNVAIHAGNALLVFGIAARVAGLSVVAAACAGVVFAVLPMQTESVAWVTGRVDSMPTLFYLAAFYLFCRWRLDGRASFYWWSLAACFAALFSKQNTVTLVPALIAYDALFFKLTLEATEGGRRPAATQALSWLPPPGERSRWLRRLAAPHIPFILLTAGYLALRYLLFHEVAREGLLTASRLPYILADMSTHIRRMILGEPGLAVSLTATAMGVGACAVVTAAIGALTNREHAKRLILPVLYFAGVWMVLGIAPTAVAGYASPRHMYLASVGWAVLLGIAFEVVWTATPSRVMKPVAVAAAATVLTVYAVRLSADVRLWDVRSMVSQQMLRDVEREALSAPPGTLIIAGAPRRSWDFALPLALRPPFTSEDLTRRVSVISDSSIHCCPAYHWEPYTRDALRAWLARPDRPPVIALYWDAGTGSLSRLSDHDDPSLRTLMGLFVETDRVASLDKAIHDLMRDLVAPHVVRR
jgi:hypothetical protein